MMYTVKEVSKRLSISLALVYREIHAGNLPARRFGKRTYRVSEADLDQYLCKSRAQPTQPVRTPRSVSTVARPATLNGKFKHIDVSRWLDSRS